MNSDPKTDMDELFSAYVDDALTQRQQTELKRLLQHQPEMAEQIARLQRQRQLLSSLPIETAPPSLVEDVKSQLERRLILDKAPALRSLRNRAALLRRRFVAAAAMLFLPLGLLGYVVWRIVTPATDETVSRPTANSLLKNEQLAPAAESSEPALPAALLFDGVLALTTERPMLAAQSIEKQVFLRSLEHQTLPNRTAERVTFQVDCSPEQMAGLLEALKPLWAQLSDSRLTLHDGAAPQQAVTIPHIRPDQIQTLVRQTDKMLMQAAARQYAAANPPLQTEDNPPVAGPEPILSPGQLTIPQPILAWPQREQNAGPSALPQPLVRLLIEVYKAE